MYIKVMSITNFLAILFDTEDWTCFTDSPYGTQIYKWPDDKHIYYSINAIDAFQDLNPQKPWHAKNKPRRADHNVSKYRNFLIEIDDMDLDEQLKYVKDKIPVSAITFSGNKSYHFIVSLKTPVSGEKYKELAKRLHTLLPKSDPTQKNASRLSRLPFRTRPDGKSQELYFLGERIDNSLFESLLPKLPNVIYRDFSNESTRQYVATEILAAVSNPDDTMERINLGGRNHFFFWLGNRFKDLNYDKAVAEHYVTLAYNNLQRKEDFSLDEALEAARVK